MTGLRFGVLGPLAVWRDGVPLTVPSGRRRAVLACLALHAGRPVAADVLVDAAWGAGRLPADARASLHTVLSRLRGVVGEDTVRLHPAGYLLDVPPEHVDAHEFVDLAGRAELAAPDEAERLLGTALDL